MKNECQCQGQNERNIYLVSTRKSTELWNLFLHKNDLNWPSRSVQYKITGERGEERGVDGAGGGVLGGDGEGGGGVGGGDRHQVVPAHPPHEHAARPQPRRELHRQVCKRPQYFLDNLLRSVCSVLNIDNRKELQTKVIRRYPKISQSRRRSLLGPLDI